VISLLVPLALIMTMTSAYAAKIIGNGGDVLVCPDRTPKVQLLDFVEARVLRKKTVKLWSPPGSNYQDKLDALVVNVGPAVSAIGTGSADRNRQF
jgi:hypothetical protein